jgi:hypothetical protein
MKIARFVGVLVLVLAAVVWGQDAPVAPAKPSSILEGRPDEKTDQTPELGAEFRSLAAGIAFRPPADGVEIKRSLGGDEVVQFIYEKQKWTMKVSRLVLSKGVPLVSDTEKDKDGIIREGLLESEAQQLKFDHGQAEILRQDPINLIQTPVGMIAARYSMGPDTFLTQRAIVQGDDPQDLYFIFDFTTPAPRTGPLDQDPETKKVVDLFTHVVESIQLLDQSQLLKDQNERLFYAKALFVNITEPKLKASLVPERWLRLIRDGKDIGYSYVVEEVAAGMPRKGEPMAIQARNTSGILVGVRSRTFPDPGVQNDAESWSWVAMDKKQEEWSNVLVTQNDNATDPKLKHIVSTENGVTTWRVKPVRDDSMQTQDNPGVRMVDDYRLTVTRNTGEPTIKQLPAFYLPKSIDHLLPRLVPLTEPKGFMFATYVNDEKEVIRRYVDVGQPGQFALGGKSIHAVPVNDRVGLEGSMTVHYMSPEGVYLGSVNADSKITILPTDKGTLEKMWKDVNLTRPGAVEGATTKPAE